MEIKYLMTFMRVAERMSFTAAADDLGYTQSAVSIQIKQLETELDCSLFERINHKIYLTDKGEELMNYARRVISLTGEFMDGTDSSVKPEGLVKIMTSDSICEQMIYRNYNDFYRRYPNIMVEFTTGTTPQMKEAIRTNSVDCIFTLDRHLFDSSLVIEKEEPVRVSFVAGADFALAGQKDIDIRELIEYPFCLTEQGVAYRAILEERLAELSLELKPSIQLNRPDIICYCLEKRPSVAFLPDFTTEKAVREGRLVRLDVKGFEVDIWKQLIHHRNKWISRTLRCVLDYIKENEFVSSEQGPFEKNP